VFEADELKERTTRVVEKTLQEDESGEKETVTTKEHV
jgi:hypothetical protein